MNQEIEQVLPNEDDAGLCGEEDFATNVNQNSNQEYTVTNQNTEALASMESMIAAYLALDKIPEDLRDPEYKEIFALIMTYLKHHCCHEFVYDYIDISPDYGCSITYCQKCGLG